MKRVLLSFILSFVLFSATAGDTKPLKEGELYNPVPAIMHHISDSHEWHLWGEGNSSFTIPLPVILFFDGGVDIFFSSKFNHNDDGTYIVKRKTNSYVKYHGKIYRLNDSEKKLKFSDSDVEHKMPPINASSPLDLSITKNVASMLLSVLVLFLLFITSATKIKNSNGPPRGLAAFLEPLILFVKEDIVKPNIGHGYQKYLPYLLTLFFFILVNNLMGLLPGAANVTGNIALTLVLSFITLIVTNLSGNKSYWSHIFKPPGVPLALMPIMIPIEIVGVFTKPFALMIRLFANISAGHIIILSLISLIFMAQSGLGTAGAYGVAPVSVIFVLFMYLIEVLVAFLQAYIFTLLTSLFIGLATVDEH